MSFVAVAIGGSALIGAGTAIYEGNQTQKAISQEQQLASQATYTPIDIPALQAAATQASITDATNSLALQRSLQPNVVKSNDALAASVADQLKMGGALPPDIASAVAQAGRTAGTSAGNTGNAAPITSALIGQSALGLLQQRQQNAETLAAANPAPTVGLSASDLASATESNNNALNSFNLAKLGVQSNLINSSAQNNAATASGVSGSLSQALSLLALTQGKTGTGTGTTLQPAGSAGTSTGYTGYGTTFNTPTLTAPSASLVPG